MRYVYIAGALLSWSALAFIYRWVESRRGNRYAMSATMGFIGAAWALGYAACGAIDLWHASADQAGIGACQGAIQVILVPVFMAAVARGDLSITWTVLTLSFSLAAAMALVYPGEQPTAMGLSGLILAGGAVALLGLDMVHRSRGPDHRRPRQGWLLFMAFSFVLNAMAMYAYSLAAAWRPNAAMADKLAFLLAGGAVFGLGGLGLTLFRSRRDGLRAGILGGVAGGTLVFVGALSTLQALAAQVPGYIVYPATTGGSSIVVVVLSVAVLKERPGRAGWLGILAGLAALLLFGLATAAGGSA